MDWRNGIIGYHRVKCFRGEFDGAVGIIDHDFFAEGVDVLFGAAGYAEAVGFARGEHDGVADLVSPEAAIGGDDHGVGLADFDSFEWYSFRIGMMPLAFGDKFVEDAGVREDQ